MFTDKSPMFGTEWMPEYLSNERMSERTSKQEARLRHTNQRHRRQCSVNVSFHGSSPFLISLGSLLQEASRGRRPRSGSGVPTSVLSEGWGSATPSIHTRFMSVLLSGRPPGAWEARARRGFLSHSTPQAISQPLSQQAQLHSPESRMGRSKESVFRKRGGISLYDNLNPTKLSFLQEVPPPSPPGGLFLVTLKLQVHNVHIMCVTKCGPPSSQWGVLRSRLLG